MTKVRGKYREQVVIAASHSQNQAEVLDFSDWGHRGLFSLYVPQMCEKMPDLLTPSSCLPPALGPKMQSRGCSSKHFWTINVLK